MEYQGSASYITTFKIIVKVLVLRALKNYFSLSDYTDFKKWFQRFLDFFRNLSYSPLTDVSYLDTLWTIMDEKSIAGNIKALRLNKKLSLDELSHLTGLTKGYLSKIERSHKAPPLSTLNKIALTMDVDVTFFLKENAEEVRDTHLTIVRKGERKKVVTKGSLYGYEYEALAFNKPGKNMEPFIISPALDGEATFQHDGEEFMYVLEGRHEFTYNGEKYILRSGDSIYFDSRVPHSGRSLGDKKAKVLTIIYSYKR